jgi:hypothetical protein
MAQSSTNVGALLDFGENGGNGMEQNNNTSKYLNIKFKFR